MQTLFISFWILSLCGAGTVLYSRDARPGPPPRRRRRNFSQARFAQRLALYEKRERRYRRIQRLALLCFAMATMCLLGSVSWFLVSLIMDA